MPIVDKSTFTIRVWDGCRVAGVVSFGRGGGGSWVGNPGGAENSTQPDIEIDPWAGLIVDHTSGRFTPVDWRDAEAHECGTDNDAPELGMEYDKP